MVKRVNIMKKKIGNTWLKKNRNDVYYKKAKQQNYRARSIFKLEQLDKKFNLLKIRGKLATSILDIGCAPGSWLQWLSKKVLPVPENQAIQKKTENKQKIKKQYSAEDGDISKQKTQPSNEIDLSPKTHRKLLVGVDLTTIKPIEGVIFHRGNILDDKFVEELTALYPHGFQIIISDAAFKTIGNQDTDHARQIGLAERVISIAEKLLIKGGNCLIKLFEGIDAQTFLKENEDKFEMVKLSKPDASRKESKEIYFVGKGWQRI